MSGFPPIPFRGELRPNQARAMEAIEAQLRAGERRLHVVAPPGSGKTVLGLYVWACHVRTPAVVLSPTSAIQAQWLARTSLFDVPESIRLSDDATRPGGLTSVTYQALTRPQARSEAIDAQAEARWAAKLVEDGAADDDEEAARWISDLAATNRAYYERRLAVHRSAITEMATREGGAFDALAGSAQAAIEALRANRVGLVILDECHHLLGHWGRVLADAHDVLDGPVVLALTATPPDARGADERDAERYRAFLGPVDFEVPVPAVVKEGHLAPYQDLVHLVRPRQEELAFVANADRAMHELVEELCSPRPEPDRLPALPAWVAGVLETRALPTGAVKSWRAFARRDPGLADHGRLFLERRGAPQPSGVPQPEPALRALPAPEDALAVTVIDRYVRHGLRRSTSGLDHALAERAVERLRLLGVQITETGSRPCASPVGRVLAYSRAKADAVVTILRQESAVLGDGIRAVVVCDFERTSADLGAAADVLDDEAGGAVAAFRAIVGDDATGELDAVLITGSTLLVDADVTDRFLESARHWLAERDRAVELEAEHAGAFARIRGRGRDWSPRTYVAMVTALFQAGVTRCLVGTRGLLGEGWDANRANVLIDLTTVTTATSVNQLRGRSIRLDPLDPAKVSDNWDVVCIADEFARGLADYERFRDKHETWYGVTEDSAVERGVGHVHAAFTDIGPQDVAELRAAINDDMLARAARRDDARARWRIGEPFANVEQPVIELRGGLATGFPPAKWEREAWSDESLTLAIGRAVLDALHEARLIAGRGRARVSARSGDFVRVLLAGADDEESRLFLEALGEAIGPLDRPRYVIPRFVRMPTPTFLSRLLPEIVGRYFRRHRLRYTMLHAVPTALARNAELAAIYTKHWNRRVGPGEAVYAHRGKGAELLTSAQQDGLVPRHGAVAGSVFE